MDGDRLERRIQNRKDWMRQHAVLDIDRMPATIFVGGQSFVRIGYVLPEDESAVRAERQKLLEKMQRVYADIVVRV